MLEEPSYKQLADIDTPSGNFDTREALSSSAVEIGVSALNISDVSAISNVTGIDKTKLQSSLGSSVPNYPCDACGMVCKTSAALDKHQVREEHCVA